MWGRSPIPHPYGRLGVASGGLIWGFGPLRAIAEGCEVASPGTERAGGVSLDEPAADQGGRAADDPGEATGAGVAA